LNILDIVQCFKVWTTSVPLHLPDGPRAKIKI